MLYKPKFCCNCGEKIQRAEWNLLTSRRFCEVCSGENKKHDIIPRVIVGGGVLAAMFGFGTFVGGSSESNAKPVNFFHESSRSEAPKPSRNEQKSEQGPQLQSNPAAPLEPVQTPPNPPEQPGNTQFAVKRDAPAAAVYYCGARTKKGTPCSRRVKVQGSKCWQHEGKPDELPEN